MTTIKALLIAKPWIGGLFYYLSNALKSKSDIQLEIIYTYPNSKFSKLNYLKNKKKWKKDIVNTNIIRRRIYFIYNIFFPFFFIF